MKRYLQQFFVDHKMATLIVGGWLNKHPGAVGGQLGHTLAHLVTPGYAIHTASGTIKDKILAQFGLK